MSVPAVPATRRGESMDWQPGPKYQAYLDRIEEILTDERRTVRDVYYALEARGFPEQLREESRDRALTKHNANPDDNPHPDYTPESEWLWEFKYRFVKRAVKKGRRAGYIDPSLIYDASRRAESTPSEGHGTPRAFLKKHVDGIESAYHENPWNDQPTHVEVWLEKQSLASVFAPICRDLNVRLEATRGDWSDSKVYEATQRLNERIEDGDDVKILYFGDFNPSGLHAPVAIQNTMAHYGLEFREELENFASTFRDPDALYFDIWPTNGAVEFEGCDGTLEFERLALNLSHIEEYDLPENPTPSSTDKDKDLRDRFMQHASDGKDVNIELNALKEYHREELEETLRSGIEDHIEEDKWQMTQKRVKNRKKAIGEAINVDYSGLPGN